MKGLLQVAAGAARVYVQELSSIKRLSETGSAQLAADLDYFCNVLAALGVALPPQLVTWQVKIQSFPDLAVAPQPHEILQSLQCVKLSYFMKHVPKW